MGGALLLSPGLSQGRTAADDDADIAQLVEHLTCNENVLRSIRGIGSRKKCNGGVPEWSKGSDCKSDGSAFGGSNPPPTTTKLFV